MGRRIAVGLVALALAATAACAGTTTTKPAAAPSKPSTSAAPALPTAVGTRPNILVIETDDMRTDEVRWMPNVRKLIQARGLTFENSFAPYPLCCPSRSSFLTGKYTHNHHVYSHLQPFGFKAFDDRVTIATLLKDSGYRTALIGKYLNGYGQDHVPRRPKEPSLYYEPPGWTQWLAGVERAWATNPLIEGGTYNYFNLTQNVNGTITSTPGRYTADVMGEQTRGVIAGFQQQPAKPWFVWWTPIAPHHGAPREPDDPKPTFTRQGAGVLWETPARPQAVKGMFDKQIKRGYGTRVKGKKSEADMSDKPRYLSDWPELNNAERLAQREVTRQRAESLFALDKQIGLTLDALRKSGQLDRTLVVFTSDNGYYLGEHRKRQGKINLHEPSLRVPLIIAGPGVPVGQRFDPITTVDMAPTFASYAALPGVPDADGADQTSMIERGDKGWGRAVVTEGMMSEYRPSHSDGFNSPLNTRGLRLGRYKITRYTTGEVELYDLLKDPLELHSLQHDPKHAKLLAEMTRLWWQYKDCKAAQCRVELPKSFRVSAAEEKRITLREAARTKAYYGDPGMPAAGY